MSQTGNTEAQTELDMRKLERIMALSESNEGALAGQQQELVRTLQEKRQLQSELHAAKECMGLMGPRIQDLQLRNSRLYDTLATALGQLASAAQVIDGPSASGDWGGDGGEAGLLLARLSEQLRLMAESVQQAVEAMRQAVLAEAGEAGLVEASPSGSGQRPDAGESPDQESASAASRRQQVQPACSTTAGPCASGGVVAAGGGLAQQRVGSAHGTGCATVGTPRSKATVSGCGTPLSAPGVAKVLDYAASPSRIKVQVLTDVA